MENIGTSFTSFRSVVEKQLAVLETKLPEGAVDELPDPEHDEVEAPALPPDTIEDIPEDKTIDVTVIHF